MGTKKNRIETTSHLLISRSEIACYSNLVSNLKDFDADAFAVVIQLFEQSKNSFDGGNFDFSYFRKHLFAIFALRMEIEIHIIEEFSTENALCISFAFYEHDAYDDFCEEYGFDDAVFDQYYSDFAANYYENERTKYFNIEPYSFFALLAPICLPSNHIYFDYGRERFICFEPGCVTETGSGIVFEGRYCEKENCAYNYYGHCGYQKIFANYPLFDSAGFCKQFISK